MDEGINNCIERELDIIESICNCCKLEKSRIKELACKYAMKHKPENILLAREERVYSQEILLAKYNGILVCIRINYPGVSKNNIATLKIMKAICDAVIKEFEEKIIYRKFDVTAEGPILILIIDELKNEVKKKCVNIEETHFLGRCVDIDVYNKEGKGISRTDLGLSPRRCYICNDLAHNCVRQGRHSLEDIKLFIEKKYVDYEINIKKNL